VSLEALRRLLSNEGGAEPKGQHPAILIAKLSAVHAGGEFGCEIRSLGTGRTVAARYGCGAACRPTAAGERKVRAPQDAVVGNAHRPSRRATAGEGPGKCNRKYTARSSG